MTRRKLTKPRKAMDHWPIMQFNKDNLPTHFELEKPKERKKPFSDKIRKVQLHFKKADLPIKKRESPPFQPCGTGIPYLPRPPCGYTYPESCCEVGGCTLHRPPKSPPPVLKVNFKSVLLTELEEQLDSTLTESDGEDDLEETFSQVKFDRLKTPDKTPLPKKWGEDGFIVPGFKDEYEPTVSVSVNGKQPFWLPALLDPESLTQVPLADVLHTATDCLPHHQ